MTYIETERPMDREQFFNYIMANFNISGEASRLIHNILSYVEELCTTESEQYHILRSLLSGTIGLSDDEIAKVHM